MAEAKSLAITCIVATPILVLFMLVCFWILKQPGLTFERKYMKALCVLIPLVIVLLSIVLLLLVLGHFIKKRRLKLMQSIKIRGESNDYFNC